MDNLKLPTTAAVLFGAIKVLEDYGWCQGLFVDRQERRCAMGAISLSGQMQRLPTISAVFALEEQIGGPIPQWNDRWWRSGRSVVRAMRRAAEKSLAKQQILV